MHHIPLKSAQTTINRLKILSAILRIIYEHQVSMNQKKNHFRMSLYLFNIISALTCMQRKIPRSAINQQILTP